MNFGQVLAMLLNGGNVTCNEIGGGAYLSLQRPAGMITEPFIALHRANGVTIPWTPAQDAILSTGWTQAVGAGDKSEHGAGAHQAHVEHASTR